MNKLTLSALLASTLIISACDKAEESTEGAMDKAPEMTEHVGEAATEHAADAGKEMTDSTMEAAEQDKAHEMADHSVGGPAQVHSVTEEYHEKMKAAGH
jgi:hypothetical protein